MSLFRLFNKDEPHKKRPAIEGLINKPVEVMVGGRVDSKPKTILIREPSNAMLGRHIGMIVNGLIGVLNANKGIIEVLSDPSKLKKENTFLFASFPEAFVRVVADLVAEDADYVEDEMTARQTTAVLATYMDLIGFDYLKEAFDWALQSWKQAGTPAEKVSPIIPPEPVEPSSKSQAS